MNATPACWRLPVCARRNTQIICKRVIRSINVIAISQSIFLVHWLRHKNDNNLDSLNIKSWTLIYSDSNIRVWWGIAKVGGKIGISIVVVVVVEGIVVPCDPLEKVVHVRVVTRAELRRVSINVNIWTWTARQISFCQRHHLNLRRIASYQNHWKCHKHYLWDCALGLQKHLTSCCCQVHQLSLET